MRVLPIAGSLLVLCSAGVGSGDLGRGGLVDVRVLAEVVVIVLLDWGDVDGSVVGDIPGVDGITPVTSLSIDASSPVSVKVLPADMQRPAQLRLRET